MLETPRQQYEYGTIAKKTTSTMEEFLEEKSKQSLLDAKPRGTNGPKGEKHYLSAL